MKIRKVFPTFPIFSHVRSGNMELSPKCCNLNYIKHSFYSPFPEVAVQGNAAAKRVKILTSVVTQFGGMFKDSKYLV